MPAQHEPPQHVPLGRIGVEAGREHQRVGIEPADELGRTALDQIHRLGQEFVVPAAGPRDLATHDADRQPGIDPAHRVAAHPQRLGEALVHEGLEVSPGREGPVAAGDRLVGGDRLDRIPAREGGTPLRVQRRERRVFPLQPGPEGGERGGRAVEIPLRGEVGDAGLVAEAEEERPARGGEREVQLRMRGHAVGDAAPPSGIVEAGVAVEDGGVGRVLAEAPLGFEEEPVDRQVRPPAMIGAVEVGGDVLDVPAEAGGAERRGALAGALGLEAFALADDLGRAVAEPRQPGIGRGWQVLVHDDFVVRPGSAGIVARGGRGGENAGGKQGEDQTVHGCGHAGFAVAGASLAGSRIAIG